MENNLGPLLVEAANLLCVGMLVVFVFLGVLIFLVKLMSNLVGGDAPIPTASNITPSRINRTTSNTQDHKVKAAISAAIHQYRQDNK